MPDRCAAQRAKVAAATEAVADLKADMVGATGSVLHGLASRMAALQRTLAQANQALAACLAAPPPTPPPTPPPPPTRPPPPPTPPPTPVPVDPFASFLSRCAAAQAKFAALEEQIADVRGDIEGATGSVLHGLAARLQQLLQQQPALGGARCKKITVHFKTLVARTATVNTFFDTQFTAMRDLYVLAQIQVLRGTTQDLSGVTSLQHLQNFNVGQCLLGAPTADHNELFSHRDNAGGNDIVVYLASTLIGGAGTFLGCATHPAGQPGAVVVNNAAQWLCAHEVGHVLDLLHVTTSPNPLSDSLMFPNVGWTNVPPDLSQTEINTMRNSALTTF